MYVADQDTPRKTELDACLPCGGGNVKISGSIVTGGGIGRFQWAPDSRRIAYIADQAVDEVLEAYTSLAGGGGNVRISGPLVPNGGGSPYIQPGISLTDFTSFAIMRQLKIADAMTQDRHFTIAGFSVVP